MKASSRTLLVMLLSVWTGATPAGTTTANLAVSASVAATCTATATPIAFGAYNPGSGAVLDASGAITVTCTTGTTYSIALSAGANPSTPGDVTTRRMSDGATHYLPYQIYLDSGHSTVWGDGTSGSLNPGSGTFTGDGSAQDRTAYGRIEAGLYVTPAMYTDTVVATITYN